MLDKFLKDAISIIVGKQAEKIVDLLNTKRHVNEFIIAKKLDLTINQTRNILYKISDYGLVSSIRKKDKRKGWYTYFWKIEILKSLEFLKDDLLKRINQFENQIKSRESKRFYVCERCNIELSEENALLHNFACVECGEILSLKNNTKLIREMKKNLVKLKKELVFVEKEIENESKKIEKRREIEMKKEAKARKEFLAKKRRKKKLEKKTKRINLKKRKSKRIKTKTKKSKSKQKKKKISLGKIRKKIKKTKKKKKR